MILAKIKSNLVLARIVNYDCKICHTIKRSFKIVNYGREIFKAQWPVLYVFYNQNYYNHKVHFSLEHNLQFWFTILTSAGLCYPQLASSMIIVL